MAVLIGDTGRATIGPLKTINITLAVPRENSSTLSPSDTSFTTSLPTVQTAGIGATFTIQQSDLPSISPNGVPMQYCAVVIVSGLNTTAGAVTVNTQAYKNGTILNAGLADYQSCAANCYWTHMVALFSNVTVGDTLNIQAYASSTGVTYDYCALTVYPTQILPSKTGTILKDLTFSNYSAGPTLVNAPSGTWNYSTFPGTYNLYIDSTHALNLGSLGPITAGSIAPYAGVMRAPYETSPASYHFSSNTTNRFAARSAIPQTITYREVLR